jgi:pimeloyl-ACP methyl ester carboxylesterase
MARLLLFLALSSALSATAAAQTHEHRIPLDRGILQIHDLNTALCNELHLPSCPDRGNVDLNSRLGSDFLLALNACLWNGCSLEATNGSTAILRTAGSDSPSKIEAIRRLSRVYTAEKEPHATAAQARNWGLLLPAEIDPARPLVVLIHGLDADRSDCVPIGRLLQAAGQQVAYFSYPGDQPIEDSAASLGRTLAKLRTSNPNLTIEIIAHSMGGLVARQYVEGPDYAGGVDRMILVAPPNHGSGWARLRTLLSIEENLHLRHDDPNWHWTWLVTEGLGQAGNDLLPGSEFLNQLNSRPRRAGVRYTIIAGNRSGVKRAEGNCVQRIASWIPRQSRSWWGVRTCYRRLQQSAEHLHVQTSDSDGPVALTSTRLPGVNDYVVLPADHISLYLAVDGNPPAAWTVIRNRIVGETVVGR